MSDPAVAAEAAPAVEKPASPAKRATFIRKCWREREKQRGKEFFRFSLILDDSLVKLTKKLIETKDINVV